MLTESKMNHKNKAVKLKKETYVRRKNKSVQYILPAIGMTVASIRSQQTDCGLYDMVRKFCLLRP